MDEDNWYERLADAIAHARKLEAALRLIRRAAIKCSQTTGAEYEEALGKLFQEIFDSTLLTSAETEAKS